MDGMQTTWSRILIGMVLCITASCSHPPDARIEKDDRPVFRVDPAKPFQIQLGRGSGWHGLDTIKISQDGTVLLNRATDRGAQSATLQLEPAAIDDLLRSIEENHLMKLDRVYGSDIEDGTQWVLRIRQGDHEKSVHFNNSFPEPIVRFVRHLDEILARHYGTASWHTVPESGVSHSRAGTVGRHQAVISAVPE